MKWYEISLLQSATLDRLNQLLDDGKFVSGSSTAGILAVGKSNTQFDRNADPDLTKQVDTLVVNDINRCPALINMCLPANITVPRYARYGVGDKYPVHCDNPLMLSAGGPVRTDLSMTVFLNDPSEYDGGELTLIDGSRTQPIKLKAGMAVVYQSGTEHMVTEVTRGVRKVAVMWIQSRVKDHRQREMLDDVGMLVERLLEEKNMPHARHAERLYGNLMRMWADV
jgi:PKHD-type hydroxylase